MNNEEIFSALNTVFQDVFDDDDIVITAETSASDIEEWDSLTHISLVVAIENTLKVKFMTGEVEDTQNVGELVELIQKKLNT